MAIGADLEMSYIQGFCETGCNWLLLEILSDCPRSCHHLFIIFHQIIPGYITDFQCIGINGRDNFRRAVLGEYWAQTDRNIRYIVSLTLFLPICLEQFARDNGLLSHDRTRPCSFKPDGGQCEVKIGWVWTNTASFRYVLLNVFIITA